MNTFDWIEFRSPDPEATARFYGSLFGWTVARTETVDGVAVRIVDTGAEPRMENLRRGGIAPTATGERPGVLVYVRVADLEASLRKVVALGGKVLSPPTRLPGGYSAVFQDPCGNVLALYQDAASRRV